MSELYPTEAEFRPVIKKHEERTFATVDKRIGEADLSPDQLAVLEQMTTPAMREKNVLSLGGYAGSGKSTLIPLLAARLGSVHRTAFVTFTGKASSVLERKLAAAGISDEAGYIGTIHRLMYKPVIDGSGVIIRWEPRDQLLTNNEVPVDRIVVDEASMVGSRLFEDLAAYDVPIVMVGDHGQLPPVNDDSLMEKPMFRLEQIHRQAADNPIIQLSQRIRECGGMPEDFEESEHIRFITQKEMSLHASESYARLGLDMAILVRANKARVNLNKIVYGGAPKVGQTVICLKNSPPIFNGMRGVVEAVKPKYSHWYDATINFPDDGFSVEAVINRHQFNMQSTISSIFDLYPKGYPRFVKDTGMLFDFGLALTVHKAQGSAFDEVFLFPEYWKNIDEKEPELYKRWLYTGVTRAAKKLFIIR